MKINHKSMESVLVFLRMQESARLL